MSVHNSTERIVVDQGDIALDPIKIALPNGQTGLLDQADAGLIAGRNLLISGGHRRPGEYVVFYAVTDGRRQKIYLHRIVIGAPAGVRVDHINRNKLDNRRCNLRLVTASQNAENQKTTDRVSFTGIRNVYWRPRRNRYLVIMKADGRARLLGSFMTIEDAIVVAENGRRSLMTHAPENAGDVS